MSGEANRSDNVNSSTHTNFDFMEKKRLNMHFCEIIENLSIDYDNKEIQDIESAIFNMLEKIKERMNERGVFNISYIQPSGSMSEKTAIWKWDKSTGESYTEFDYIAVLKPENIVGNDCRGCLKVTKQPINLERFKLLYNDTRDDLINNIGDIRIFNNVFLQELLICLTFSCDCFSPSFKDSSFEGLFRKFSIVPSDKDDMGLCDQCVIKMSTGVLRINTNATIDMNKPPTNCSLIFLWESETGSLLAPADVWSNKTEPLRSLTIYVDFIPALEILKLDRTEGVLKPDHDIFIVPKRCALRKTCENRCVDGAWRTSSCLSEIKTILNFDEKHRNCFKVVKFLCQAMASSYKFGFYPVNRYHVKVIVIDHTRRCADLLSENCVMDCVMDILYELETTYKSRQHPQQRVLNTGDAEQTSSDLHSFFHGCGIPGFESSRFRNLISSLCEASKTESSEMFIKTLMPSDN